VNGLVVPLRRADDGRTGAVYERLRDLMAEASPDALPEWIGAFERLKAESMLRLLAAPQQSPVMEDRLLTAPEAAAKLGCPKDWLYRNADKLPFTVRRSPRRVAFSQLGIEKYIRQRAG
jgi:predicted DNA-binding transcriptional regulator AlpA